ncbi:sugar-binding transcriptional regulator [Vagococcus lutrae]|uniref:sugar-binding transcriptional regulator n=1 Tax=Vagococcus lutrae TaxID=81947 RepID=UPI001C9875B4|nr:sugar-binding transcriptional regulator [Vagococcus lutrae]QZN88160.1 sugar-binding transcriptional regulator [Vagococcus lutrae]
MAYSDDVRLLIEIAQMYYEEEAKQVEVAERFNISRSLVSKYLTKAKDLGLVEIVIHDEQLHPYNQLEKRLKNVLNLSEVIIISSVGETLLKKKLGEAAEKYLTRILKDNSIVGISAGTTVKEVAKAVTGKINMPNVTFVPMVGGLGTDHTDFQANVICDIFSKQYGSKMVELHVPVVVDSIQAKEVFMEQRYIKSKFQLAKEADIALVGIGGKPVYSTMTKYYFEEVGANVINNSNDVIGDICYNFIDRDGNLSDTDWNSRALTIDLDYLKKIPNVVAITGGRDKVEAIIAASKAGLINTLVTDSNTAKQILKENMYVVSKEEEN